MKKKVLLLMGIFYLGLLSAQIGINTENPKGLLHIDAGVVGDVRDDVVVTADGNVGVGTDQPQNKLTIEKANPVIGDDTGLYLPNGAKAGSALVSDAVGNAIWDEGSVQYQTMVAAEGTTVINKGKEHIVAPDVLPEVFVKMETLTNVYFDKVRDVFGAPYGWDPLNSHYVVPADGTYRISFSVYFQPNRDPVTNQSLNTGDNLRAYIYLTRGSWGAGSVNLIEPGIISVTNDGNDISQLKMGLVKLLKDDIIDVRLYNYPKVTTPPRERRVDYWAGDGHTFILIESL